MSINTPAPAGQHRTDPRPPDTGPGAARDYARRLREDGGTYRGIAAAAGLAPTTVHDLVSGRRPGTPYTATALRAVTSQALPRARLDAGGTRLRLRALHVMGHGSARIARAAGVREMTIRALVRGDARTISPKLRDKMTASMTPGGTNAPPNAPAPNAAPPPSPAAGPSPGTGAPPPPWTTTSSMSPATAPARAGNPPPAPAPPPASARPARHHGGGGRVAADDRMNLDFILQFLDVLERHGYHYHDDQHTGRAVGLLGDLARIYEGTQETPAATYHAEVPSSPQAQTARPDREQTGTPSSSRPPRSGSSRPRWAKPPTTSATGPPPAPTARTGPAAPASGACGAPRPTATWPPRCSGPPRPPGPPPAGSLPPAPPTQPAASPRQQPTGRPASDQPRPDTGRTRNPPPSRRSPCPRPAAGGRGHARAAGPL